MIREFRSEDTKDLIQIINNGLVADETDILDSIKDDDKKLLVYADGGIKGFILMKITEKETQKCNIQLYVDPKERRKGIGTALYNETASYIQETTPNILITEFRVDQDDPTIFYRKLGYKKWYECHELYYKGTFQPESDIKFVPYEDKYFEQYIKCIQDSFYELRKENDFQPYRSFENDPESVENFITKRKEFKYIALNDKDEIIAAFDLNGACIELVFIPPTSQGKGYGKKTVQYAINKALNESTKPIHLSVIGTNGKAIDLYESLSFETTQAMHVYRQFTDK